MVTGITPVTVTFLAQEIRPRAARRIERVFRGKPWAWGPKLPLPFGADTLVRAANWKVKAEVHEVKEHTLSMLKKQWRESVSLLDGYIDLYQIHSATTESGVLENNEVLEELARLREQGIRVGLSLTGPGQSEVLRKAMKIVFDGSHLFECVQATWNLLEQSAGPALAEAHAAGIGVIIKEALANGRLTERNDDPDFAPKLTILKRESERLNIPVDTLVIAATLSEPVADIILSGAADAHQLLSNVRGCGTVLDDDARARLLAIVESSHEYWDKRRRLPWN